MKRTVLPNANTDVRKYYVRANDKLWLKKSKFIGKNITEDEEINHGGA